MYVWLNSIGGQGHVSEPQPTSASARDGSGLTNQDEIFRIGRGSVPACLVKVWFYWVIIWRGPEPNGEGQIFSQKYRYTSSVYLENFNLIGQTTSIPLPSTASFVAHWHGPEPNGEGQVFSQTCRHTPYTYSKNFILIGWSISIPQALQRHLCLTDMALDPMERAKTLARRAGMIYHSPHQYWARSNQVRPKILKNLILGQ